MCDDHDRLSVMLIPRSIKLFIIPPHLHWCRQRCVSASFWYWAVNWSPWTILQDCPFPPDKKTCRYLQYSLDILWYYHRMWKHLTFGLNPFWSESSGSLQIGHLTGVISLWRRCTASAQLWFVCRMEYGPIDPQQEECTCGSETENMKTENRGMTTTYQPNNVVSFSKTTRGRHDGWMNQ